MHCGPNLEVRVQVQRNCPGPGPDRTSDSLLETLSYFIVYMSHHINPHSVKCYLSGLVQQLELDHPAIRDFHNSRHITKVMRGCLKMNTKAVSRKSTLSLDDVRLVCDRFKHSISHNNLLFVAMLLTGFHGLLRLGELTLPDSSSIRDWRKVTQRQSLVLRHNEFEFLLPAHKANRFFEGRKLCSDSCFQFII